MSTFGTPQYDEATTTGAAGTAADAPQAEILDPNDPRLVSETFADDTTKDAYEIPPPAPDGIWRAKLKLGKVTGQDGKPADWKPWSHPNVNNGHPMFVAAVESNLIDLSGKYDGTRVTDNFVKSGIDPKRNTCQMTTITVKAGGTPAVSPGTEAARRDALLKTLAGEPEVLVETNWEASCQSCGEKADKAGEKRPRPFLFGMHRFPQPKTGVFDPSVKCPACNTLCRAQVRLFRYYKIGEVKATRGLA
jgi:hypothetical protein